MVVPFEIAAIGAGEGILFQIDRPLVAAGLRNPDGQDNPQLMRYLDQIGIGQEIGAHLASVVERVPEGFFQPIGIVDSADRAVLFNPEEDNAAMGIGHGAVCFPKAFGHSAPGGFELQFSVFRPVKAGEDINGIKGMFVFHGAAFLMPP